ncbi:MAG: amino acid ABC transporter substrate-binding protein [Acidobacteriaceae bacterium]|nr:amino acid ABC transporter substrate-binding protein [Acidobacteriaceae bacterium]MBV9502715.1 amino acid ABC transporter substrate-binding protein [Acidobacteriaceae bacterium]
MAALLLARPGGSAGAPEAPRTLVSGTLRIGTYFVNPPFEYVANNGARVGFEVDLMGEIARGLGLKAVFVNTHWEAILQELQGGRYDCIVGAITITPERERQLAWSVPYLTTTLSLVVNEAKTPGQRSLADLRHGTVGVQAATTDYDAALAMQRRGEIGRIKVYPFDRIEQAMRDLEVGLITAVMKIEPVAAWLAAKNPHLRILGQVPDHPQPLGIGFRKAERALVAAIDRALGAMQRDGSMDRLKAKWAVP